MCHRSGAAAVSDEAREGSEQRRGPAATTVDNSRLGPALEVLEGVDLVELVREPELPLEAVALRHGVAAALSLREQVEHPLHPAEGEAAGREQEQRLPGGERVRGDTVAQEGPRSAWALQEGGKAEQSGGRVKVTARLGAGEALVLSGVVVGGRLRLPLAAPGPAVVALAEALRVAQHAGARAGQVTLCGENTKCMAHAGVSPSRASQKEKQSSLLRLKSARTSTWSRHASTTSSGALLASFAASRGSVPSSADPGSGTGGSTREVNCTSR